MHRNFELLAIDLLLLFAGIVLSVRFWSAVPFIHVAIACIAVIGLALFHTKDDIIFFAGGVLLDGLGEISAVHFGVWNYAIPDIWGIPLWIPIIWGASFMLIRRIRNSIFRLMNRRLVERQPASKKSTFMLIYDVGMYALVLALVVTLWQDNLVLTILLALLCAVNLARFHHAHDVFIVLFVGIIGSIGDFYAVHFGLWTYTNPSFFGQPLWVFPLYAVFGLITVRTAFVFSKLHKRATSLQ